jgi:hypothetical protein
MEECGGTGKPDDPCKNPNYHPQQDEEEKSLEEIQVQRFLRRETLNFIKYPTNWFEDDSGMRYCCLERTKRNGDTEVGFMVPGERLTVFLYSFWELKEEFEELREEGEEVVFDLGDFYFKVYKSLKRMYAAGWRLA